MKDQIIVALIHLSYLIPLIGFHITGLDGFFNLLILFCITLGVIGSFSIIKIITLSEEEKEEIFKNNFINLSSTLRTIMSIIVSLFMIWHIDIYYIPAIFHFLWSASLVNTYFFAKRYKTR